MMKKFLLFIISFMLIGNICAAEFDCQIDGYAITYNDSGEIVAAKNPQGTEVNKNLESFFNPKSASECPTDKVAKISIIDSFRTLYVAREGEQLDNDLNPNNPSNPDIVRACYDYISRPTCEDSIKTGKVACVWKSLGEDKSGNDIGFCSTTGLTYVSCGDAIDIPSEVPRIASLAVTFLKIATAIVLILMGTLTLLKAIYSSKEDEIKKAQSSFIKKLIAAALVFLIVSIVQFVVLKVADTGSDGEDAGLKECLSCFLNDDCDSVTYYKNVDFADNETCFKIPTAANAIPTEITCPALPTN